VKRHREQQAEAFRQLYEQRADSEAERLRREADKREKARRNQEDRVAEEAKRKQRERRNRQQAEDFARINREREEQQEQERQRRRMSTNSQVSRDAKLLSAWNSYQSRWSILLTPVVGQAVPGLTFATVPWPLEDIPSGPQQVTKDAVSHFVLSELHSVGKSRRARLRQLLLLFHPDKFLVR